MNPITPVTIVNCQEWQGVYVNGDLDYENHRVSLREFCNSVSNIDVTVRYKQASEELEDYVQGAGELPPTLHECEELGLY